MSHLAFGRPNAGRDFRGTPLQVHGCQERPRVSQAITTAPGTAYPSTSATRTGSIPPTRANPGPTRMTSSTGPTPYSFLKQTAPRSYADTLGRLGSDGSSSSFGRRSRTPLKRHGDFDSLRSLNQRGTSPRNVVRRPCELPRMSHLAFGRPNARCDFRGSRAQGADRWGRQPSLGASPGCGRRGGRLRVRRRVRGGSARRPCPPRSGCRWAGPPRSGRAAGRRREHRSRCSPG